MDQPTVDGLNAYWICRAAAHAGFKVALSGQGGDELFGGYSSLRNFERFTHAAAWLRPVPRGFATAMLDHDAFPFRWRKLAYLASADDPFVAAELAVKIHFLRRDVHELLDPELAAAGEDGEFAERGEEAGALSATGRDALGRGFTRKSCVSRYSRAPRAASPARRRRHEHGPQPRTAPGVSGPQAR